MEDWVQAFRRGLPVAWDIAILKERKTRERSVIQSVAVRDDPVIMIVLSLELAQFLPLLGSEGELQVDDKGQPLATPMSTSFTLAGGIDGVSSACDCFSDPVKWSSGISAPVLKSPVDGYCGVTCYQLGRSQVARRVRISRGLIGHLEFPTIPAHESRRSGAPTCSNKPAASISV